MQVLHSSSCNDPLTYGFSLAVAVQSCYQPTVLQTLWCAVNLTNCPSPLAVWGSYIDARGHDVTLDLCLPRRDRTLAGCLCASEYTWQHSDNLSDWTDLSTAGDAYALDQQEHGPYFGTCNLTSNAAGTMVARLKALAIFCD